MLTSEVSLKYIVYSQDSQTYVPVCTVWNVILREQNLLKKIRIPADDKIKQSYLVH